MLAIALCGARKLHMTRNSHQPSSGTFHFSRVMNGQRYPIKGQGQNLSSVSAILAFGIWSDMDNLTPSSASLAILGPHSGSPSLPHVPPALHLSSERTPTVLLPVIRVHGNCSVKKFLWPHLYSLADQVVVPSTASYNLIRSLGIPEDRITLTPYSVDNDWWKKQSSRVDRAAVRRSWGVAPETSVILFCAKLQPWKRPLDLLRAFALATIPNSALVFAGEGPLRSELETEAASMGIADRVHFLGFVNQSQLPSVYTASDLMVLPSEYEPFAVVVNEAFCCGCPVIASDRVGAAQDLIAPVNPSFIFPCGNVDALAQILKVALGNPVALTEYGHAARRRMETWSIRENISGTVEAVRRAIARRDRGGSNNTGVST